MYNLEMISTNTPMVLVALLLLRIQPSIADTGTSRHTYCRSVRIACGGFPAALQQITTTRTSGGYFGLSGHTTFPIASGSTPGIRGGLDIASGTDFFHGHAWVITTQDKLTTICMHFRMVPWLCWFRRLSARVLKIEFSQNSPPNILPRYKKHSYIGRRVTSVTNTTETIKKQDHNSN